MALEAELKATKSREYHYKTTLAHFGGAEVMSSFLNSYHEFAEAIVDGHCLGLYF